MAFKIEFNQESRIKKFAESNNITFEKAKEILDDYDKEVDRQMEWLYHDLLKK